MTPKVTVLQLDTQFPRIPGDVACPATYCGDVEIIQIPRATVDKIVSARPDIIDIKPFEQAVQRATGDVIVTSCGFLSYWQNHLAALTEKPFISSALIAFDGLRQAYAAADVITLTFDKASLTKQHFGPNADYDIGTVGLPRDMHLRRVISENLPELDVGLVANELTNFISAIKRQHHKHLVLECTNLPPYKSQLHRATGLGITDILSCIEDIQPGSIQPQFLI